MKLIIIIKVIIFLLIPKSILATKDTISVVLFATSDDVYNNKPSTTNALVVTDELAPNYFFANKIIDKVTNKKVKESKFIWGIKYKDEIYVNMGYMEDITTVRMYIKLDVCGQYCAIVYDERMPYKRAENPYSYGGGIVGHLAAKASGYVDNNHLWKIDEKKSVPIYVCNLLEKEPRNFQMTRNESALMSFISKKDLTKIHKKYPHVQLGKDPSAMDVVSFFKEINR